MYPSVVFPAGLHKQVFFTSLIFAYKQNSSISYLTKFYSHHLMHFFIQPIINLSSYIKISKILYEALQHVSIFYEIIFREFFIYFLVDVADIKNY